MTSGHNQCNTEHTKQKYGESELDGKHEARHCFRFTPPRRIECHPSLRAVEARSSPVMSDAKYGMSDFSIIRNGAQGLFRPEQLESNTTLCLA
ncbi:MAG TPA: hypothetical protein VF745_12040 [Steroidobacteraceae bacterium]